MVWGISKCEHDSARYFYCNYITRDHAAGFRLISIYIIVE